VKQFGSRVLALLGLLLLVAPPAFADRTSFAEIQAVMCAAADARGDTYRPPFCQAQCTCSIPTTLSACEAGAPGTFLAGSPALTSCVQEREACEIFNGIHSCVSSSFEACNLDEDCSNGEKCNPQLPAGACDVSGELCGPGYGSCPPSETCLTPSACTHFCIGYVDCPAMTNTVCADDNTTPCSVDLDCSGENVTLSNVGPADAADPASCFVNVRAGESSTVPISSSDALACLAEITAQTGPCQ
jgi:hypothetical protein